jgi:hypothetical protein
VEPIQRRADRSRAVNRRLFLYIAFRAFFERTDLAGPIKPQKRLRILGRCRNLKIAFVASENVLSGGAGDRIEAGSRCFIDPTSGALEMSVDLRLKPREALSREVRRIKTRL